MIDTDRTYYCLNSDIGNISVNRYNNKYGYTSRFQSIVKTEKIYLEKSMLYLHMILFTCS